MPRKKTHDEYVAELAEQGSGVTVVGRYVGAHVKIDHRCSCGNVWSAEPHGVKKGYRCGCILAKTGHRRKTHEEHVEELATLDNGFEVVGTYINKRTPIEYKCLCGKLRKMEPNDVLKFSKRSSGCGCDFVRDHDDYLSKVVKLDNGVVVLGEYVHTQHKINHRCSCGRRWKATPHRVLRGGRCGCIGIGTRNDRAYIVLIRDDLPEAIPTVDGQHAPIYLTRDGLLGYLVKFGVTSQDVKKDRVAVWARANNLTDVETLTTVDTPVGQASQLVERRMLVKFERPDWIPNDWDGSTEFRLVPADELNDVVASLRWLANMCEVVKT